MKAHARRVLLFQEARQVPLADILQRYGVLASLKRSGRQLAGICPIHRGTNKRQFAVDLHQNVWHCFGDCATGAFPGGSSIEFVCAIEKIDAAKAVELMAQWFALSGTHRTDKQPTRRSVMSTGSKPSHRVYLVEDRGEERDPFWHAVGSAWPSKDGGFQIQLPPGLSVSGRIVMRPYTEKDEEEDAGKAAKNKKRQ